MKCLGGMTNILFRPTDLGPTLVSIGGCMCVLVLSQQLSIWYFSDYW